MAAVGMLMVIGMLIIGSLIYFLFSVSFVKGLSDDKKKQRLYLALCLSVPFFIATLNYQGFCFMKMRFLNEEDIYEALNCSEYRNCKSTEKLNTCYGAYVFASKKIYGNFEKDLDGIHMYDNGFLSRILGLSYARIQGVKSNHPVIITNCGSIIFSEI